MRERSLFHGNGKYSMFSRIIYKHFKSREWFSYKDVMAEFLEHPIDDNQKLSSYEGYGELKKAFVGVIKAISSECPIYERGNNHNKEFRYIGQDDNPLSDMERAKIIRDLREYFQFAQDSAGFFPMAWLEYFLKDTRDLLDIQITKRKGNDILSTSLEAEHTNIEWLPILYKAIVEQRVLSIDYKPYEKEPYTLTFHPHYLKEYNGRWHVFGYYHYDGDDYWGYDLALDRIISKPRTTPKEKYRPAPKGYYKERFKNIIGVCLYDGVETKDIILRAYSKTVFNLIETKPLHGSQKTIAPFNGSFGDFSMQVKINKELIGTILKMGADLEVISPEDVRENIKETINMLVKRYFVE